MVSCHDKLHGKKKRSYMVLRWWICVSVLCVVALVFSYSAYYAYAWFEDQGFFEHIEELSQYSSPKHSVLYDAHGSVIRESYSEFRKYVTYKDIPQSVIDAVISIEDQNFFSHRGVDFRAIVRAAWRNFRSGEIRQGGSTITQQLVRDSVLNREKSYERKLREVILAVLLEKQLSKQKILELYLNSMFLGSNAYGIASASLRFFARPLSELELHEQALIVGLFQAPSRYNPYRNRRNAIQRQRQVLKAMYRHGKISKQEWIRAIRKPLRFNSSALANNSTEGSEGYFLDYVESEAKKILGVSSLKNRGYSIYTSIDPRVFGLMRQAVEKMESKLAALEQRNRVMNKDLRLEISAVVMNVQTGLIEGMLGGRDYGVSNFNRAYQALRSPGSAFKPVVYSYALSQGYLWSDVFFLSPITIGDTYRPRSMSSQYLKESTLLKSLYSSINMTSIEVGKKLGIFNVITHAEKMGILSPIKKEYGSLIGQSEVTVLDMLRMYSTFANQGKRIQPAAILRIEDAHGKEVFRVADKEDRELSVLSEKVNYLMVQGLRKVLSHGTARGAYNLSHIAAGKTGTTNESIDNWFCGFTEDYVMVVWVGADVPQPLLNGRNAGATLALPIWSSVITPLSESAKTKAFGRPEGVKRFRIDPRFGHISQTGIEAWFLDGTKPPQKASMLTLIDSKKKMIRGFDTPSNRTLLAP